MLPHGIIRPIRLAVTLIIIVLLAVLAGTSVAAPGDHSRNSTNKKDARAAKAKASGRDSQPARQDSPRINTGRQTPTFGAGNPAHGAQPGSGRQTPTFGTGNTGSGTQPGSSRQTPTFGAGNSGNGAQPGSSRQTPTFGTGNSGNGAQPGSSRQTPTFGAGNSTHGAQPGSSRQTGSVDRATPAGKQSYKYHPVQKPEASSTQPGNNRGNQGNRGNQVSRDNQVNKNNRVDQGRRPTPASRPSRPDYSAYHHPTVGPIRSSSRVSDRGSYQSRDYRPPTYSGGSYHYPTHFQNRPLHFGFWVFGNYDPLFCRKSVYFNFGYFPYVQVARVWVGPYVEVTYVSSPVVVSDGYYLSSSDTFGPDNALADIRNAWTNGRFDLIKNHVRAGDKIAVLLDGKYDYSLDAEDYLQMTSDAVDQIQSTSFVWTGTKERTDGQYTAFGRHEYRDASGADKTTYVSYTLEMIDGDYFITEVGSSASRLM